MKINFFPACIIALLFYLPAGAQKQKIKFHSINSFGILFGEKGNDVLFQTVNGVANENFFAGIGFGGDYYRYKSYPLFADARAFLGKDNKVFVYGNLGYNFSGKNTPGKEIYYYSSYHFSGGVYTDAGLGYRTKLIGKVFFTISAGFSYKEINNKITVVQECLTPPCAVDYSKYKYGNGRAVLKAGIDF